ncbi:MAG: PIN domain-containing protein [Gemmatimonadota bacterium]
MARSVFVDTSGWYALIDRRDVDHAATMDTVERVICGGTRLVSTDYVIDESCTLAKARAGSEAALRLLDLLNGTAALDLEWIGPDRFYRAEALFRKYRDQRFSFTDCTSFAVMRERGIGEVITGDEHFRIMGFQLLPARS